MAEELVADAVAELVVDLLEPVEVDEEDGDVLAVAERPVDLEVQAGPVRKLRQWIDLGLHAGAVERAASLDHQGDLRGERLQLPDSLGRRQQAVLRIVGEHDAEPSSRREIDRDDERLAVPSAATAPPPPTGSRKGPVVPQQVLAEPRAWIAQEVVLLSTSPAQLGDQLLPRHVDLRPFAVNDGAQVRVLPGGLTRVALREGSLIVNSSQGGGSKDTLGADLLAGRDAEADGASSVPPAGGTRRRARPRSPPGPAAVRGREPGC